MAQLGFRFLAALNPSILLFKGAFVAADLGICYLLSRRFGDRATLLYAWNPLVIYSFAGGGHYDSWFMLALVAAWLHWDYPQQQKERRSPSNLLISAKVKSALLVGISIATKWMSIPVLGFMAWRQIRSPEKLTSGAQKSNRIFRNLGLAIALMLLGCLPFLLTTIPFCQDWRCPVLPLNSRFVNHGSSASLIPQWVDNTWPDSEHLNWVYAVPLGISVLWGMWRFKSVGRFTEHYLITLMLLSPIIHAWYFTWLVPFAVASRNWGTYLVSLSAFVYFALPYNIASEIFSWMLAPWQRNLLWWPFLVGLFLSGIQRQPSER